MYVYAGKRWHIVSWIREVVCATANEVILVHVSFQVSIVDNNWDNDFIEISIQGETETIIWVSIQASTLNWHLVRSVLVQMQGNLHWVFLIN